MSEQPKTIQIYLPDGEPRGLRFAEITTRLVQAIVIPVKRLDDAFKRPELDQAAVYFLFGERDEDSRPLVYIGETEDLVARLKHHRAKKDFWNTAVVVVSRNGFTKGHVKYLEWFCLNECEQTDRFEIENTTRPSEAYLPEPMKAETIDAFETMDILLSALGYPVFEPTRARTPEHASSSFRCKVKAAEAAGELTDDGFVVFKGSTAVVEERPSIPDAIRAMRKRMVEDQTLAEHNSLLLFQRDHVFNSPSTAASVVAGGSMNGWKQWKNEQGRRLTDVYRSAGA